MFLSLKLLLVCGVFFHVLIFFFNDTATTEIYTLSLHDALPISTGTTCSASSASPPTSMGSRSAPWLPTSARRSRGRERRDRKSTRLNSSHSQISYAVFCLKKKKRKGGQRHLSRSAEPASRSPWH